jgi:penicillin amidase
MVRPAGIKAEQGHPGPDPYSPVPKRPGRSGKEVAPPGQCGFIAPDGAKSPHYDDQLKMYETFGRKRMWITKEDVEKNKASEVVLVY